MKAMKWHRRVLVIAAVVVVVAAAGAFIAGDPFATSSVATLRPNDAQVLAIGQKVYQAQCAACHGAKLEGQANWRLRDAQGRLPAPPHDASGHTWHHPDELLFRITKYGVAKAAQLENYDSAMPAYEKVLGDAEIVAVLSWIKAQWPAEIKAKHDKMNASVMSTR